MLYQTKTKDWGVLFYIILRRFLSKKAVIFMVNSKFRCNFATLFENTF